MRLQAAPWSAPSPATAPPSRDVPSCGIILEFIHPGETLVVTRIDRLARSLRDLQVIVAILKDKGAHLAATEQPVDTSTSAGKAFFDMLGVFAEFETNLRRERQAERDRRGEAMWRLSWPPILGSTRQAIKQRLSMDLVADGDCPQIGDLTRNRLQGQGCHDGRRVTRPARFVFTPRNVVIHLEV